MEVGVDTARSAPPDAARAPESCQEGANLIDSKESPRTSSTDSPPAKADGSVRREDFPGARDAPPRWEARPSAGRLCAFGEPGQRPRSGGLSCKFGADEPIAQPGRGTERLTTGRNPNSKLLLRIRRTRGTHEGSGCDTRGRALRSSPAAPRRGRFGTLSLHWAEKRPRRKSP